MGCPVEDSGAERVVLYNSGRMPPEQAAEFELHLRSCEECRELSESQRAVWLALDEWPAIDVSAEFDQRLYRRIAQEQERVWWRRLLTSGRWWRPAVPVAIACGALVSAFLLKTPAVNPVAPSGAEPKLQIEQVEHALDDMDMLKQMSLDTQADTSHPAERI